MSEDTERLGEILYWLATIIAVLIVVWVVGNYVFNIDRAYPVIPILPLVLAGAIWLVGWACRYVLAGR
jgi:hypothetical protein